MDSRRISRSSQGTKASNYGKVQGQSRASKHSRSSTKSHSASLIKSKSSAAKASFSKMLDDLSLESGSKTESTHCPLHTQLYALVGLPPRKFAIGPSFLQLAYFKNPDNGAGWNLEKDSIRLPFEIPEIFAALLEYLARGDYAPQLREVLVEIAPRTPASPAILTSIIGGQPTSISNYQYINETTLFASSPMACSPRHFVERSMPTSKHWPSGTLTSPKTGQLDAAMIRSPAPSLRMTPGASIPASPSQPFATALRHAAPNSGPRNDSPAIGLDNAALARWGLESRIDPQRPIVNWQSPHLVASDTSSVADCDSISVFSRVSKVSHRTNTTVQSSPRIHTTHPSSPVSPTSSKVSKSPAPMYNAERFSHVPHNHCSPAHSLPYASAQKQFCTSLTLDGDFMADVMYSDRRGNRLHKDLLVYLTATKFGIPALQEKAITKLALRINVADEVLIRSAAVCYNPAYGVERAKSVFLKHMTRSGERFAMHRSMQELAEQGCALRTDLLRYIWAAKAVAKSPH